MDNYQARKALLEQEKIDWENEKQIILEELQLEADKKEIYEKQKGKKKISTSKILMFFMFINCALIEFFTCYITMADIKLAYTTGMSVDFGPIIALISAIVGQVISYGIYSAKAAKENTQGGITYQNMMNENRQNQLANIDCENYYTDEEDDDQDGEIYENVIDESGGEI